MNPPQPPTQVLLVSTNLRFMMRRITLQGARAIEGANNAYVLPQRGVVVDPGPPTDRSWRILQMGLSDAGLSVTDVEHVLITHWHADHSGLAPRLAEQAGATVYLHENDASLVRDYQASQDRRMRTTVQQLRAWGVPEAIVKEVMRRESTGASMASCNVTDLHDGDEVAEIRVIHSPGHTSGHVAFLTDEHLFLGDTVLPNYTPNVGGTDIRLENPLGLYLWSLVRLLGLRETGYPGHGSAVKLDERINEIVTHHEDRCREIYDTLEGRETTPWTIAEELFGEMHGIHAQLGVGEAATHLGYLEAEGYVQRTGEDPATFALVADSPTPRIDLVTVDSST